MRTAAAAACLAGALAASAGCGSGSDRAAAHVAQAEEHLAAGRLDEALIDLNSALKLAPDDANVCERIGALLVLKGDLADARFYFGEAWRIDPTRYEAAIGLASLQLDEDRDEARALVADVVDRAPGSAWGPIGQSELALADVEPFAAIEHAERAVELEPSLPQAHWQLARAKTALIRDFVINGETPPDSVFEDALAQLARYAELDPDRAWRALAERARIASAWPGHADDGEAALREASERLRALDLPREEFEILERAQELGERDHRPALSEWALERKIELVPDRYESWEELAALYAATDRRPALVYERLIARFPDETEPYVRMAQFVRRKRGMRKSIPYLESKLESGLDDATLLAEIARHQSMLGRHKASLETIAKLQARFPDSPETAVMTAWGWLRSRRPELALQVLAELPGADENLQAQRVLADAHAMAGDASGARAALERIVALSKEPDLLTLRKLARALHDDHAYAKARQLFERVQRRAALAPLERALYARCLYETAAPAVGRRILENVVDLPDPPQTAVLELFAREGRAPAQRERLRGGFARALADAPNSPELLEALVAFESAAGTPERALAPVARSVAFAREHGNPLGPVLLLQARIEAAKGDIEGARATVVEVLDVEPKLAGALELAVQLHPTKEDASRAITEMTKDTPSLELPASRQGLMGRLYYRVGNEAMARYSYEQALSGGVDLPILKNDLAFLLAKAHSDLDRALLLARQASEALPEEAGVVDTLGFVLLRKDDAEKAADQFRRALAIAERRGQPRAEIHYHLGLALSKLERMTEAEQAFAAALDLGEDFPDAAAARKELAALRGQI
ncbi:MAG: hypothetical protein R3E88_01100 [Myxococcota bacterium]